MTDAEARVKAIEMWAFSRDERGPLPAAENKKAWFEIRQLAEFISQGSSIKPYQDQPK